MEVGAVSIVCPGNIGPKQQGTTYTYPLGLPRVKSYGI